MTEKDSGFEDDDVVKAGGAGAKNEDSSAEGAGALTEDGGAFAESGAVAGETDTLAEDIDAVTEKPDTLEEDIDAVINGGFLSEAAEAAAEGGAGVTDVALASEDTLLVEGKKKKVKEPKMFGVKKLPPILRKTYTSKSLRRRLLKKLYIPEDRENVQALFIEGGNPKKPEKLAVSGERLFSKKEIAYYKKLAREIRSQKAIIKFAPLTAVVVFIVTVVTLVGIFKNPLVKKGIKAGCEAAFGAKTDIGYVNLSIFSARLTVKNLAIGNKNSVMRNLFEAETIDLDFNLVQLLRKKFVVQNIECSGMAFNTPRTTSCYLPPKEKKEEEESAFSKELKARSNAAVADIKNQAYNLLGGSDVDSIIANTMAHIKTPDVAKAALSTSKDLVEKWKAKPDELKAQVEDFGATVKDLQNIKLDSFDVRKKEDWEALNAALEKINAAIAKSKEMKADAQSLVDNVKGDVKLVQDTAAGVKESAEADVAYAKERLTTLTGAIKNADQLFSNALTTVAYRMLGDYYPQAKELYDKAMELKAEADARNAKKKAKELEKRKGRERLKGTTFWYNTGYPSLLIERVMASGPGFSAQINEITNDQDWRGRPTVFNGGLSLSGLSHSANVTFDMRKSSSAPLISAGYKGSGFKADFDGTRVAVKSGVPSLNGPAVLNVNLTADPSGFTAGGSVNLDPLNMVSDGFENEMVSKYYNIALASVNKLSLGFNTSWSKADGLALALTGNFGEQFVNSLKSVVMEIGKDAKNMALKRIQDEINNSSNEVLAKAKEFLDIEGDIDLQNVKLSDLQGILEKKKVEVETKLKEKANQAANDASEKAVDALKEKIKETTGSDQASDAAGNAAADAASKLLKGLGF